MLRFAIGIFLATVALASLGFAHAQTQPADDSLRIYAVDIWQDPPQSWGPGRGVYLGKGLVLTAQHVVGLSLTPSRACASLAWTCPRMPSEKAMSSEWI
jgi:hypothetical protein